MIGMVGYQDDVIGFGLTGIEKLIELTPSASKEDVLAAILSLKDNVKALIINEALYRKVHDEKSIKDIFIIQIPENKKEANIDQIEKLARETLGISL